MRLIDADEIKKIISKSLSEYSGEYSTDMINMWGLFTQIIDEAPTVLHDNYNMGYQDGVRKVLSERPTGEWKVSDNRWGLGSLRCSNCNIYYDTDPNYCPNCGAYMKGAKNDK